MIEVELRALDNISKKSHKMISKYKLARLRRQNLACCTICFETGPVELFYKSPSRHKACHKAFRKKYYKQNKEAEKAQASIYQRSNPEKCVEKKARWARKNPDRIAEYSKRASSKRKLLGKKQSYKKWSELSPVEKIKNSIRSRIRGLLKSKRKYHFNDYIGCTPRELELHLESQFLPGMTWENYGKWHVDHIIPLASVDLTDNQAFLRVSSYLNLQPLWAIDNLKKGKTLNYSTPSATKSINK